MSEDIAELKRDMDMSSDHEQPTPADLVDMALRLKAEASPTYQELVGEDLPIDQLAELWLLTLYYQRAAKNVLDVVATELGKRLQKHGGGVTVLDEWVVFKTSKSSKIEDPEGFWEWMKANPDLLEVAFNPNSIRKTGIPSSVLDTFYEVVESPNPVVTSIPVHVLERNKQRKEQNNG